jgi:hypothetical protein
METHSVIMSRKSKYWQDTSSSQISIYTHHKLAYTLNKILIKMPANYIVHIKKISNAVYLCMSMEK